VVIFTLGEGRGGSRKRRNEALKRFVCLAPAGIIMWGHDYPRLLAYRSCPGSLDWEWGEVSRREEVWGVSLRLPVKGGG